MVQIDDYACWVFADDLFGKLTQFTASNLNSSPKKQTSAQKITR